MKERMEMVTADPRPAGEKIHVRKDRNGGNNEIRDVV